MGNHPAERSVVVATGFGSDFRRFFFRGLAAMLPALLTVMIIVWVLQFVDIHVGVHVNKLVKWIVVQWMSVAGKHELSLHGPDVLWNRVKLFWEDWQFNWVGFILSFVLIYVFGRFVASILGRAMWRLIERSFFRLPIVKQIYPSVKQVTDFLLAERKMEFSRVVAVEYPRKGVWSLGLVTNEGMRTLCEVLGQDLVTVFVPSSPTPVTGYAITVQRSEVIDLPLSIDDALRLVVSGGVIMPLSQMPLSHAMDDSSLKQVPRGLIPLESRKSKETPA
jgi:uncharacterized membrane protein